MRERCGCTAKQGDDLAVDVYTLVVRIAELRRMHAKADVHDVGAYGVAFANLVAGHSVVFAVAQGLVGTVTVQKHRRTLGVDAVRDQRHLLIPALVSTSLGTEQRKLFRYVLRRVVVAGCACKATRHSVVREDLVMASERHLVNERKRRLDVVALLIRKARRGGQYRGGQYNKGVYLQMLCSGVSAAALSA